ncbi:hypothetical protein BDC45DRAFT_600944 [Circinella umbellata]|nr:hypothetical protein BDC45DRAFT_600944 [Circinella umbellata]
MSVDPKIKNCSCAMNCVYFIGPGYVADETLFVIETISACTQFLMNKPLESPSNPIMHPVANEKNNEVDMTIGNKRRYAVYSDESKARVFQQMLECCCCFKTIGYSCPSSAEMDQPLLRGPWKYF